MTTISFSLATARSFAAIDDFPAGPLESARLFDDARGDLVRNPGATASDDAVIASAMDPAKTLGAAKDVEQSQDSDDTREAADQEEEDATKADQTAKGVDTQ